MLPNVEVSGGARPHRAASSLLPGWASAKPYDQENAIAINPIAAIKSILHRLTAAEYSP